MALTTCWECKKEISDTAAVCPHCGAAGTAGTMLTPLSAATPSPPTRAVKKSGGGTWLPWVIGVPIGLIILMLVMGANF